LGRESGLVAGAGADFSGLEEGSTEGGGGGSLLKFSGFPFREGLGGVEVEGIGRGVEKFSAEALFFIEGGGVADESWDLLSSKLARRSSNWSLLDLIIRFSAVWWKRGLKRRKDERRKQIGGEGKIQGGNCGSFAMAATIAFL